MTRASFLTCWIVAVVQLFLSFSESQRRWQWHLYILFLHYPLHILHLPLLELFPKRQVVSERIIYLKKTSEKSTKWTKWKITFKYWNSCANLVLFHKDYSTPYRENESKVASCWKRISKFIKDDLPISQSAMCSDRYLNLSCQTFGGKVVFPENWFLLKMIF